MSEVIISLLSQGLPVSPLSPLSKMQLGLAPAKAGAQWPRQSPHPEQSACQSSVLHTRAHLERPVGGLWSGPLWPPPPRAFSSQCRLPPAQAFFPISLPLDVSHVFPLVLFLSLASFPFQLMQPPWVMSSTWAPSAPYPQTAVTPGCPPAAHRISGWPPSTQPSAPHTSHCLSCTAQLRSTSHWLFPGQSFTWALLWFPHFLTSVPTPSPPQALPRKQPAGPPLPL